MVGEFVYLVEEVVWVVGDGFIIVPFPVVFTYVVPYCDVIIGIVYPGFELITVDGHCGGLVAVVIAQLGLLDYGRGFLARAVTIKLLGPT